MHDRLIRIATLLTLCAWLAPSVGALGVGLHVVWGHHDHAHGEPVHQLHDLLDVATHGHHHDLEATAEHDHFATIDGGTPSLRPTLTQAAVPISSPCPARSFGTRVHKDGDPRRGPPGPLFTAHCSLLL